MPKILFAMQDYSPSIGGAEDYQAVLNDNQDALDYLNENINMNDFQQAHTATFNYDNTEFMILSYYTVEYTYDACGIEIVERKWVKADSDYYPLKDKHDKS